MSVDFKQINKQTNKQICKRRQHGPMATTTKEQLPNPLPSNVYSLSYDGVKSPDIKALRWYHTVGAVAVDQ
eukprot:6821789-Pyramimonas_sp.AAC.1